MELVYQLRPFPCMGWGTVFHCPGCMPGPDEGDIQIGNVDGYRTDIYVYLQRLSHMAQENLPVFNAVSSAKLKNISTQVPDWTDNEKIF